MSGHNKWSTIKHKKGKADAARGKLFTKLIRELTVATREGGKDAEGNPRLRSAVYAARDANMSNDTIDRAIKRGAGELEGEVYDEITYEGYGPGGIAYIVETMTTNRNRTVAEVRHAFNKHGGELGTAGSVAWMFERKGYVEVQAAGANFDKLFEVAVEAGATDVVEDGDVFAVDCEFTDLNAVTQAVEKAGFKVTAAKPVRTAANMIPAEGALAESTMKLMEVLDDLDDTQNVYTNAEISDEEMERISN